MNPERDHVIDVQALRRDFGSFRAVNDVSFHVARGEIFGWLGANGAGKSTTIRMLCGLLAPTGGAARVAGHDIATSPEMVKSSIGYMSQRFSLYMDLHVEENLEFFGGVQGLSGGALRRRIDEVLAETELGAHRAALTGSLPGGIRQRLALASAILHNPSIVFLDEPTAGVDPTSRRAFWALIRRLARSGVTVFVTTHYMDEAEYCGRIGLMVDGNLVALDTPEGLKREWVPGVMEVVHGEGVHTLAPALRALPGMIAVEPMGAALRIRHAALDRAALDTLVGSLPGGFREPGEANLEDVFLAVAARGKDAA